MMKRITVFAKRKRKGFTLLELAIVLLAASAVIGALWVAGQAVWDNYRVYRVNQQITTAVQSIRDNYGNTFQTWDKHIPTWAPPLDITKPLDALSLLPVEMRRNPYAPLGPGLTEMDHVINNDVVGGSFHVFTEVDPNTLSLNAFRIQLLGLTSGPCAKLLMTLPLTDETIGVVRIAAPPTAAYVTNVLNGVGVTAGILPMNITTAKTWCSYPGNTNEIDIDFKLHS